MALVGASAIVATTCGVAIVPHHLPAVADNDPSGANLVVNGDFEDGLSSWQEVEPAAASQVPHEGDGAGKVQEGGSISQELSLVPETGYQVTAQVKGSARVGVTVAGQDAFAVVDNDDNDDYEEVSFDFYSSGFDVGTLSVSSDSEARVDSITVSEITDEPPTEEPPSDEPPTEEPPSTETPTTDPPGVPFNECNEEITAPVAPGNPDGSANDNLVFNGTFENNLSGWRQVEPAAGSGDAYEGEGSGKLETNGSVSQEVFLQPGATYELSAYVKGTAVIGVAAAGEELTVDVDNDEFTNVTIEFESGDDELGTITAFSPSEARIDNVSVTKLSGGSDSVPPAVSPGSVFDFSIWEVEGQNPVERNGTIAFEPLREQVLTPNGNGWRHEMKVMPSERYGLTEQYERFSADIEVNMSPGSEPIAAQHHPEGLGTLSALYILDTQHPENGGLTNGVANDGIFDVIVAIRKPGAERVEEGDPPPEQTVGGSYEEEIVVLGTVQSGDSFNYEVINDHGTITMTGLCETATVVSEDSSASYLKWGNYIQARNSVTAERVEDQASYASFYAENGITESRLVFSNVEYNRILD